MYGYNARRSQASYRIALCKEKGPPEKKAILICCCRYMYVDWSCSCCSLVKAVRLCSKFTLLVPAYKFCVKLHFCTLCDHPRSKVTCYGPLCVARAQPNIAKFYLWATRKSLFLHQTYMLGTLDFKCLEISGSQLFFLEHSLGCLIHVQVCSQHL